MEQEKTMSPEEKLAKYEEFLKDFIDDKTHSIGVIIAGPDDLGFYRTAIGGDHILLKCAPDVKEKFEQEDEVVVVDKKFIIDKLSTVLRTLTEDYNFDTIDWKEIGGLTSQVERIREAIEGPILNKKLYEDFGMKPLSGLLLYGPPGVGKTMIAKAIATVILEGTPGATKDNFIYMKGGEMLARYVGEAENNIKRLFANARETQRKTKKQVIVFIDEAEAILPVRGSRMSSDVDTTIVPTFLAEMDGLNKDNPFVILSTNHPKNIDPAVVRDGRIDLHVKITRPSKEDAKEIFKIYLDKSLCKTSSDSLADFATEQVFTREKCVEKVSGAYIQTVVQKSTLVALKRYSKDSKTPKGVITDDILTALENA